ncbi:xanthine dehydrogenase YagS FAD-binding subunit [Asanoa ferruginea]|uniref:Xanthine dehydrogenase YagS FAD-binding subunit n=1 Tax=Asanoa ferruginea TaxID=53367 RepID=A0A3D9ZXZ8_9ACTN|nr:xanthine dehydrogenase family protein subunit M [Asanoa ferruginea]REG01463.1 xanthine dehydrogenase YagS FAD-binding subunit [Asanoa ferruginea]GIF47910.1 oxidoreductase [Asanoa ferruginea]
MREFAYARARDVDSAVALVADNPGARYLGGGTNLVDLMKLGVERPDLLVDVTGLPLDEVSEDDGGGLRVGAEVRNSDLAAHPLVRHRYPMLSEALLSAASGQLRNVATTGGNLMQRTRCGYFTDPAKACNKRVPGSGCPAIEGLHQNLAILGASDHCVATHPSDLAVALAALDARVLVHDLAGPREVPLDDFYRPVGDRPDREVNIRDGTLVTGIVLPPPVAGRSHYRKVRERASYAFAIGSVAALLAIEADRVSEVRIALGAVASHPWRARVAERSVHGGPATAAAFEVAAEAELDAARPLRDNAYKVPLIRDLIVAVLTELAGR